MVRDWITEDEQMAFSPENQRWVQDQVEASIRKALDGLNPPSRAKRTLHHLRDWGLTAMIYAIPLGLIGLCVTLGVRVSSDVREESSFRTRTEDHFKTIENSLKELGHQSQMGKNSLPLGDHTIVDSGHDDLVGGSPSLQSFVRMDQKTFVASLSILQRVTSEEPHQPPNRPDIKAIAERLRNTDESTSDYWPATLQFVHFASKNLAPPGVPPAGPPWFIYDNGSNNTYSGSVWEGKAFYFGHSANLINVIFRRSRIVLGQEGRLSLRNVIFIDCIFDFPSISVKPSDTIKTVVRSLLSSDIGNGKVG